MDSYVYINGGHSAHSSGSLGGKPDTVIVVSTATQSGTVDLSNGSYSGSALIFSFQGNGPGVYNVVPSVSALVAADAASAPIIVETNIGTAVTTGASLYTASSGTVTATLGTDGKLHFATTEPLPMAKTQDVLGGVAGAPVTMSLMVHDAY